MSPCPGPSACSSGASSVRLPFLEETGIFKSLVFVGQVPHTASHLILSALLSLPPAPFPALLPDPSENAHLWGTYCVLGHLQTLSPLSTTLFSSPDSFLPSLLSDLRLPPSLPPGGGNGHILSTYCVLGSLHIFPPFFPPVSPLSPPHPSGLSALFQGKERTFTEHLWHAKQSPVLPQLSSHPAISLTCGFCCFLLSAREGTGTY